MSGLCLLVTSGGRGMRVVTCVAMTVGLVHAFMQDLGFLPAVLRAGRSQDEDGGDGGGEGGFFHEWDGKEVLYPKVNETLCNDLFARMRAHLFTRPQRAA
jgi:hypothetical protein